MTLALTHGGGAGTAPLHCAIIPRISTYPATPAAAIPFPLTVVARSTLLDRLVDERARVLLACEALGLPVAEIDGALAALTGPVAAELVKRARAQVFDEMCRPRDAKGARGWCSGHSVATMCGTGLCALTPTRSKADRAP